MKNIILSITTGGITNLILSGLIISSYGSRKEENKIFWIQPKMGWEVNYGTNQIYALDNSGGVNPNVGIGTDNPLSRFHLLGDFYNQGFVGLKSYYEPSGISWTDVTTLNYTSHGTGEDGSVVLIYAHLQTNASGGAVDGFIRVLRDGTPIASACGGGFYDIWSGQWGYFGVTLVTYDEPGAGSHTYTLQRENVLPQNGYTFFIIELKR
ncbi:MAG: hypothetical protein ABIN23_06950 [candidate division WOR-3 bacterium]